GVCFWLPGAWRGLPQILSNRRAAATPENTTVGAGEALAMGCLQAVGMLPGVSRSGSTIFGGVCAGLERSVAAKFSFMMSAPAIVAGMLSEGKDALESGLSFGNDLAAILVGMLVAFVAGYLSIRFFMKLISRVSLNGFALYVTALGILVIVLQLTGVMSDAPAVETVQGFIRQLAAIFG
ncbi:MAG: undecaprenyl-diphosphate phosphatase, partial [Clostridia bacterium]|nr:undecaprenyl-diphosphate phosphatase [Clostridia bacterium]